MTISTTTNRWSYTGDGSTAAFAYTNKILEDSDLKVYVGGTLKTLTTHYTVSGAGDVSGGSVTFTAGNIPAAAASVIIVRDIPTTQGTDFLDAGAFPAANTEDAVDKLTIISQQQDDDISRTLRQPETDASAIGRLPAKADRLGKLLQFNSSTGDPEVVAAADLSLSTVTPFAETLLDDTTPAAARSTLGAGAVGENVFTAATAAAAQQAMDTEVGVDVQAYDADLTAIAAIAASSGRRLISNGTGWVLDDTPFGIRNRLINGDFSVNQRGATSVADDAYCFDRWYALTETGNVTVAQQTLQEDGTPFNIRLTQPDVGAKQIGIAQIIEAANCRDLRSKAITFRLRVRNSDGGQVNYAILEWAGAADSVTSDVISAWAGSPTYIANVTERAKGTVTPAANTWTTVTGVTGTINAAANNLIVLIWSNADMAQNATLDLARAQLEVGSVATVFERRPFGQELALCQRYYEKTFELATAPAQNVGSLAGTLVSIATATTGPVCTWQFKATKRVAPTLTTYNPHAANTGWRDTGNTATVAFGSVGAAGVNTVTIGAGAAAAGVANYHIHATADAEL